ncbi:hypothetical protein [Ferruginibacter albus]|uniref:hypothetical protein n=1 Tax=Ferruginibacter albus TaxID=2875540 RepID=UPI001CC53C41|nr:hypothetical protein [Ferruginibacter albus]UAY51314.1 hypothetical protein K9M53_12020 [Ferruginibacter albus]
MPKSKKNKATKLPAANVAQLTAANEPRQWVLLTVLVIVLFVAFSPSLSAYYINLDDPILLLDNKTLKVFSTKWSWNAVWHIFTNEFGGTFIPLVILSYAVEIFFFAPDPYASPFIFHLDNVLLHIGCAVLVFFILKKMNINKWGSFIGALLWGINPMKVDSVSWVTERKDLLYGFFFLLSLLTYIQYIRVDKSKTKWYLLTIFFSLFSYLSKTQAVTLPLCMIAIDFYFKREHWRTPRLLLLEKLPWWFFSIMTGVITVSFTHTYHVTGTWEAVIPYTFIQKLAVACYTYASYIVKFIYPYQLAYYPFPQQFPVIAYLCLAIVPLTLAAVIWMARKNIVILTGFALFTVNVMLMFNIPFDGAGYMTGRFTYIAYIGLILIVIPAYLQWKYKNKKILLTAYILLLLFITYRQGSVWQNTVSFWKYNISENKDDYYNYLGLGLYYQDIAQNKWKDPFVNANDPQIKQLAFQNIETARIKDSLNGATDSFTTAKILNAHGVSYTILNSNNEAIVDFNKAIALSPGLNEAYANRGWCYYLQNNYALAWEDYAQYTKMDTTNAVMYYIYAICAGNMNKFSEGLNGINKAISLNSTNAEYYHVKSRFFHFLNQPDSMHIYAQKAKEMGIDVEPMLFK